MASVQGGDQDTVGPLDARSLQHTNLDMLDSQLASDVTFRFSSLDGLSSSSSSSSDVRAHKCILMSRSDVFLAMFTSGLAETRDDVVNIQDIDPEAFRVILRYIYGADDDLAPDNVQQVLYAAKKYLLGGLVDRCERVLRSGLTVDNACSALELSSQYSLPRLQSDCLSLVGEHMQSIVQTEAFQHLSADLLELIVGQDRLEFSDEGEVYETCVAWARRRLAQSTPRQQQLDYPTDRQIREQLGDVIYRVRFPTMRAGEFGRIVGGSDMLTAAEKNEVYLNICVGPRPSVPFDSAPRRFSNPRALRFDVSSRYVFATCSNRPTTASISFQPSIGTTLTAIGLYGGVEPSTHAVTVAVQYGHRMLGELSTDMVSDGRPVPVRITLATPVALEANRIYTVRASLTGTPNTYYGRAGDFYVSFYGNETIHFREADNFARYAEFAQGQIPALYFHVPLSK